MVVFDIDEMFQHFHFQKKYSGLKKNCLQYFMFSSRFYTTTFKIFLFIYLLNGKWFPQIVDL